MIRRSLWYVMLALLCCGAVVLAVNATNQAKKMQQADNTVSVPPSSRNLVAPRIAELGSGTTTAAAKLTDNKEQQAAVAPVDQGPPSPYNYDAINARLEKELLEAAQSPSIDNDTPVPDAELDVQPEWAAPSADEEIAYLLEQITAAKAAGMEPNPAWDIRLNELIPPSRNDDGNLDQGGVDWANATQIPSAGPFPWTDTGDTEAGANDDCVGRPYGDVFYYINITTAGLYTFDMCGTTPDSYIKWYKNPSAACTATNTGTSDDICSNDPQFSVTLAVGDVFYLECGLFSNTGAVSPYNFQVQYTPPPPNPTCATASVVADGPYPVVLSSLTTCGGVDDYNATCLGTYDAGEDVIFSWTPSVTGSYTIMLDPGTVTSTGVLIDDNCPPDASGCVAFATSSTAYPHGIGPVALTGGTTYYIMVDRLTSGGCFNYSLTFNTWTSPAPGDNCANPITITDAQTLTGQSSMFYTDDYNATCLGTYDAGRDKIYQWTVTVAGDYVINVNPYATTSTGVLVDDNCPPDASGCIAFATNSSATPYGIGCRHYEPGTYYIMVDRLTTGAGIFQYDLATGPCPTGDICENVNVLTDNASLTGETTVGFSDNYNATCLGTYDAGYDKVYQWNVATAGYYLITLNPYTTTGTGILVDDNCPPDASGCLAFSTNSSATPHSIACSYYNVGTYYIMVDRNTTNGSITTYDLTIGACPAGDRCEFPVVINDVVSLTGETTVGYSDNYNTTCLGTYDAGFDKVYQWNVTTAGEYTITVNPGSTTGAGVLVDDNCPPDVTGCLGFATNSSASAFGIACSYYPVGTYYIMVDRSTTGGAITAYDLTIATCTSPAGEGCWNAVPISDAVSLVGETTVGYANNYAATCLVSGTTRYDNGLDKLYAWTVSAAGDYTITLNPYTTTSTGFLVDSDCPGAGNSCLYWRTNTAATPYSLCHFFDVGTYFIMVDRSTAGTGYTYDLTITAGTCPAPCADFTMTAPGSVSSTGLGTTDDCSIRTGAENIVEVTIPNPGLWTFQMCGVTPTWDSYIYLTTLCGGGTILAFNDDGCGGVGFSKITCFNLTSAGTYYVDIEPYSTSTVPTAWTMTVTECVPCPDITCTFDLNESEPNGGCRYTPTQALNTIACGQTVHGVVSGTLEARDIDGWEFTLGSTQQVTITVNPEFDATLAIYSATAPGACPDVSVVTRNDSGDCRTEVYTACLLAGTYHAYVYPPFVDTQGDQNYCMTLSCAPCPQGRCCYGTDPYNPLCAVNSQLECNGLSGDWTEGLDCNTPCPLPPPEENCEGAILLSIPSSVQGSNLEAINDSLVGCPSGATMGHEIWYRVVGDGTTLTATTCNDGYTFDTEIQVWSGSCDNLICIGGNDDMSSACPDHTLASRVIWCAEIGVTYYIQVGSYSYSSSQGSFQLDLTSDGVQCSCPPITCPPEAVEESEPNAGCSTTTPGPLNPIICGDVVHGAVTATTTTRDVDAYTITLASPSILTALVHSEFDAIVWLYREVGVTCPDSDVTSVNSAAICQDETLISPCLPAGVYHIYVAPAFAAMPTPRDYCLTVSCSPCEVPLGRCCYGDLNAPSCAVNNMFECDNLGGVWTQGQTCDTPCPTLTCPAESMLSQSPTQPGAGGTFVTSETSTSYTAFEDFFSADAPIGSITFWGTTLYYNGTAWQVCSENPVPFEIKFYEYGATPGAVVCTYTPTITGELVAYYGTYPTYRYHYTLPTRCSVNPGWVSIRGMGDANCWFMWLNSPTGNGSSVQYDGTTYSTLAYDLSLCLGAAPCPKAENVSVYMAPGNTNLWLHYTATAAGDYYIFSTTNKNNDGDPTGGDADFVLAQIQSVAAPGVQTWTDLGPILPYKNYVVVNNCTVASVVGRCCYGAPPSCVVNTFNECEALSGTWTYGLTCAEECPLVNYCESTYSNCPNPDDWITNVTFNTINNTSVDECATLHYGDYTALSTNVTRSQSYQLSVSFYSEGTWTEHVHVWFDWNRDATFETAEGYYLGSGVDATLTTNITIPADAALGSTRLRVIEQFSTDPTTPCNPHSSSYGETEDYTIVVQ